MTTTFNMAWYKTATNEELKLAEKAEKFEADYFEDMTFRPGTPLHDDFISEPFLDSKGFEVEGGVDINFLEISIISYCFKASQLRKSEGWCNGKKRIITISTKKLEDDSTLLHEMIHAYENILLRKDYFYLRLTLRDLLTHFLFRNLSNKIKNLNDVIHEFIHLRPYDDKTRDGGFHSLLFLLKSLDLDFRLAIKPGTVFGYGLDNFIILKDTGEEI